MVPLHPRRAACAPGRTHHTVRCLKLGNCEKQLLRHAYLRRLRQRCSFASVTFSVPTLFHAGNLEIAPRSLEGDFRTPAPLFFSYAVYRQVVPSSMVRVSVLVRGVRLAVGTES